MMYNMGICQFQSVLGRFPYITIQSIGLLTRLSLLIFVAIAHHFICLVVFHVNLGLLFATIMQPNHIGARCLGRA